MAGFEALFFNIKDGYLGNTLFYTAKHSLSSEKLLFTEAIVRGHKSGLLNHIDYNNLCQCESLEDIKLNLVRGLIDRLREMRFVCSPPLTMASIWRICHRR